MNKQASVFVPGNRYQSSLIFPGKARNEPIEWSTVG